MLKSRSHVDQRLRESELRLKIALKAAQIGVWDWNLATGEMAYSARARAIFGFPPGVPITFEMVRDTTYPDDLPQTAALSKRATNPEIRDKSPYEYRVLRADNGEVRWVLAHGEAIFATVDGETKAIRYLGTVQDITERKRTETALEESETRSRLAIGAARMAVWELDITTDTVRASGPLNRMFGFPEDATPTVDDYRARYGPGERDRVRAAGQRALEAGESQFEVEFRCCRPDGNLYWLLLRAEVVFAPDGTPERAIGVLMDIDDRKRNSDRQMLLARELNHRVKNSLTVVQSLASQTFRGLEACQAPLKAFQERLQALSKANNVLLDQDWELFGLLPLIEEITSPYRHEFDDPFDIEGADVDLPPVANVPVALALHELCTNAAKYGALSAPEGRVGISWSPRAGGIELIWQEFGGPEAVVPGQKGFGLRMLTDVLARQVGPVELEFLPDGLRCRMLLPVSLASGA